MRELSRKSVELKFGYRLVEHEGREFAQLLINKVPVEGVIHRLLEGRILTDPEIMRVLLQRWIVPMSPSLYRGL